MDDLVDVQERDQVAFEDMQALEYPFEPVFQPTPNLSSCSGVKLV